MFYQYLKGKKLPKSTQCNTKKAEIKRQRNLRVAGLLVILLALSLALSSAVFAAESDPIYIGFTSDVHGETDRLGTWLEKLKDSTQTLDRMVFGGDYPNRMQDAASWTVAQQCVNIVKEVYGENTPCVLVRGNHDWQVTGDFDKGLVYNGDDYAVYAIDSATNVSTWTFSIDDINDLANELNSIDSSKPVFVASHCPIHYYSGRTTVNAGALLNELNEHENVIFIWGHNHTVGDPYYGNVMTKGFKIKTTAYGQEQPINFTYLSHGSILDGNNGAYGLLAALEKDGDATKIDFDYKNLSGETVSGGSVKIGDDTSEEDEPIDSVSISGITAPAAGAEPDTTATTGDSSYTVSAVSWSPAVSGSFNYDTEYTASVTVTASSGYYFADDVTATVNGKNASSVIKNSNGTLTVSYTFPRTASAPAVSYQLADSLEDGETYLIVAETSSGNRYALTNNVASGSYMAGTMVTVQGNEVVASGVTEAMLWRAEKDGEYTYFKNNGHYLKRESGPNGQLNANSSDKPGQGYGGWLYDNSANRLYTISTSQQGAGTKYYLYYESGSQRYFRAYSQGGSTIKLYKLVQSVPPATQYSLTLSGENISSVPAAGLIDENTQVTITVAPAEGMQVATFTVNGVDKKSELVDNKYTFIITGDTTVSVTYEAIPLPKHVITIAPVKGGTATVTTDPADEAEAGETVIVNIADIQGGKQFKSISVKDANDGSIETTVVTKGKRYSFTMPDKAVTVTVEVKEISAGSGGGGSGGGSGGGGSGGSRDRYEEITIPDEDIPASGVSVGTDAYPGFKDVPEDAWYYESVKFTVMNGLIKGISADLFEPDTTITRGMFVTILSRFEFGSDDRVPEGDSGFTDLSQDWYKNAIAWAFQNKIAFGISDTEFDPDGILTREQLVTFLYRYAQYKGYETSYDIEALSVFTDNNLINDYARPAMSWAFKHGLLTGSTNTTLAPHDHATRAQSAAIFMRFVSFTDQSTKI
jgi:hypothetical protein